MVGVFKEAFDSFSCESPARREQQIVVSHLSCEFAVRDRYLFILKIDTSDFTLNKLNAMVQHRLAKVE